MSQRSPENLNSVISWCLWYFFLIPCLYVEYAYEIVDVHSVRWMKMRDFVFPNDVRFT